MGKQNDVGSSVILELWQDDKELVRTTNWLVTLPVAQLIQTWNSQEIVNNALTMASSLMKALL